MSDPGGQKSRLLSKDEPEASEAVPQSLEADGVEVLLDITASRFVRQGERHVLIAEHDSGERRIAFDRVLVALGRAANTARVGLAEIGIETRDDGTILTDDYLQTTVPGIYACGDVADPCQFTHTASHQAWYATVNALFGTFRRFKVDYSVIPWSTFTDPEVAHVGLTQTEAEARNLGGSRTASAGEPRGQLRSSA